MGGRSLRVQDHPGRFTAIFPLNTVHHFVAEKTAQSVKCWPHKHENLSSIPQNPLFKSGVLGCRDGRVLEVNGLAHLAESANLRFNAKPCLKTQENEEA